MPLLENNVTVTEEPKSESSDSDEEINYDPAKGKWVDGGKLHPRTQKEI